MTILFIILSVWGGIMNMVVVLANDGKMPVKCDIEYNTNKHFCCQEESEVRFPELSDKYKIKQLYFSKGDFFSVFGYVFGAFSLSVVLFTYWRKEDE